MLYDTKIYKINLLLILKHFNFFNTLVLPKAIIFSLYE